MTDRPAFPPDFIILVRHGRFAGNVRAGKRGAAIDPINNPQSQDEGLDTYGQEQIERVHQWLDTNGYFDLVDDYLRSPQPNEPFPNLRYRHSPYARTADTARILRPDVYWTPDPRLVERLRPIFVSQKQLEEFFPDIARFKEQHPLKWRPEDGETLPEAGWRIVSVIRGLSRSALLVTHGEAMWGVRHVLGGMTEEAIRDALILERAGEGLSPLEIRNGQVEIYTSIDPVTGLKCNGFCAMRSVNPAYPDDMRDTGWQPIASPVLLKPSINPFVIGGDVALS